MTLPQLLFVYSGSSKHEGIRMSGIGIALLALLSLAYRDRRDVLVVWALLLMLLLCSMEVANPVARLVKTIVPFQWSNPTRTVLLACLPLGLLAGFGAEACLTAPQTVPGKVGRALLAGIAGAGMLAVLGAFAHPHPFLNIGAGVFLFPAGVTVLLAASSWLRIRRGGWLLLPALLFAETLAWNRTEVPYFFAKLPRFGGAAAALHVAPEPALENRRGTAFGNAHLYSLTPIMNGYDPLRLRRVDQVLCSPQREAVYGRGVYPWDVTGDNARGNLFAKRFFWLARQYVEGPLPGKRELFPCVTTVFLEPGAEAPIPKVERAGLPRSSVSPGASRTPVPLPSSPIVVENTAHQTDHRETIEIEEIHAPRLHSALLLRYAAQGAIRVEPRFRDVTSGRVEYGLRFEARSASDQQIEVPLPDFEILQATLDVAFLEPAGSFTLQECRLLSDLNDEDACLRIVSRSANGIEVEVKDIAQPRVLTFIDADYDGWSAFVNGKRTPIYRANEAFKAVALQPGHSRVRFEFASKWVSTGIVVSAAACCATTAVLLILFFRKLSS
jgi:hypothetical protein